MSEYQYYEFCSINKPLSKDARHEMQSLSSRVNVGSHTASYVYNYGDFRGNPTQLVLKHFDMFFYISNFGTVQLILKYNVNEVDLQKIQAFVRDNVIEIHSHGDNVLIHIWINNEEGFGWTEGEGILPDLLPIHSEIQHGNNQILQLALAIDDVCSGTEPDSIKDLVREITLSATSNTFLECAGID